MERVISGLIAIPIVLGIILYGHPLLFFVLIGSLILVSTYEYFSMIENAGKSGFPVEGLVLSFFILVFYFFIVIPTLANVHLLRTWSTSAVRCVVVYRV